MRKLCFIFVIFFGIFFFAGQSFAATINAASCSQADVQSAINQASNGDTITIPAGTCTWTSGATVPSGIGISIFGAGTPNSGASSTGAAPSCSATAITDDMTSGGDIFLLQPTTNSSGSRISCMKILGQGGLGANALNSPFAVQGTCNATTCPNLRIDNVTFDGSLQGTISNSDSMIITDNVFGVLDHNNAAGVLGAQGMEFVNFNNSAWNGVGAFGDNSWSSADSFGTSKALYLENNSFGAGVVVGETEASVPNGGEGGGRIAARFNECNGCLSAMSGHGTESNGRPRGVRQVEYYGNNFLCTYTNSCSSAVGLRSGVAIMFGNKLNAGPGSWMNAYLSFAEYRSLQSIGGWGACDGTGQYDNNDPTTYYTGTIASVDLSWPYVITVSGTPNWTNNQWVNTNAPYSIHDASINNGSEIVGSGANTISVYPWTSIPYAVGDTIQIRRAYACIDQPNRSGGTLLSGWTPSPVGGVIQTLDPSYEWNDSGYNPVFGNVSGAWTARFIANRDWYTDDSHGTPHAQTSPTNPFNGASGVGFGTLANRPTTCTSGVGYWATDQGSWNQSSNGFGQGTLYVCTSTNTWTLYYTPFTYPYPLDAKGLPNPTSNGDTTPPAAPSGVSVQ